MLLHRLALSRLLVILAWVSPKGRHLLHKLTSQVQTNAELPRLLRILFASMEFGSPLVMSCFSQGALLPPTKLEPLRSGGLETMKWEI